MTTLELRTVFDSPLGVPNFQVSLYINTIVFLLKKVQSSSLNMVEMDTIRRMSNLPHGDLEP